MVSTTEVAGRGGNTRNGPAAKKNQPKPNNKKAVGFKGDAKAESVLHAKVITCGSNQARQIIVLVSSLSTYIGEKGYPHWAESMRLMERKNQDNFMPADVGRSTYGAMNAAGVFLWNENVLDTDDRYTRDMKVWDRSVSAGINQWNKYVNNGESLCLAIKGQVEPSLWDKTKDDTRFAAIQALQCPIGLINLMKERCTGGSAGV